MSTFKRRFAHLKNAKLVSVVYFKKQKLEQAYCFNTKQFCINNNKLNTSNTNNTSNTDVDTDTDTDEKRLVS